MTTSYEGGGWPDKHAVIDELNRKFNIDLKIQWIPQDKYPQKLGVIGNIKSLQISTTKKINHYKMDTTVQSRRLPIPLISMFGAFY
jgi:hypothetical protein